MTPVSLTDRLTPVPVCSDTDPLLVAWQFFQQSGSPYLIICDRQQVPLGVLSLATLLPYLSLTPQTPANLPQPSSAQPNSAQPEQAASPTRKRKTRNSNSIATFLQQNHLTLEPIATLPLNPSATLQHHLLSHPPNTHCILIDPHSGHCLGLLDRTPHPLPSHPITSAPPHLPLTPLIDLLERLPLPLMLQTSTGQMLTQNLAWRQQLGELQNPELVRREAATVLESTVPQEAIAYPPHELVTQTTSQLQASTSQWSDLDSTFLKNWVNRTEPSVASENLCQLSPDSDSCVCFCPMKSGQDRIWKFSKISLGTALSSLVAIDRANQETTVDPTTFQLATLDFQPDPAWDALMQTESLWLVLAQDITEQQQVARELAAKNADLMQLNRLKDEFLACISHELKTPLTAVLGLSSLLKDQALGDLNERQSRYAQLIYQSGRHLMWVVNDILDVTRIETGQLELSLATVRIADLCWRSYEQAQQLETTASGEASVPPHSTAANSAPKFTLEIAPGLETLIADELRLRQMLANLLSNALKFTEPEGVLGLKVERWDNWIAFTVWDTGIGIPEDKQHLVFQKFQQLENPLTRQFKGTGLGLVLTQRLARLHGGDVTFTSVEGRGSQFTILMPPIPPQAVLDFSNGSNSQHIPQPTTRSVLSQTIDRTVNPSESPVVSLDFNTAENRLVLVVEASPRLIETLSESLVNLGYRVAIARSGTEALEKSRRLQPAIIFLNPLLPTLSGWDVLTLLKADAATQHIPVVVTAMRVEREQALHHNADRFLSLPIKIPALEECLTKLIQPKSDPTQDTLLKLTILHLQAGGPSTFPLSPATDSAMVQAGIDRPLVDDLNRLLHPHHCRLLEVDDLEQADLLARVWQPDVILLDGIAPEPERYLERLGQQCFLSELPIVTLTLEMTQAANLIPNLTVFPCLSQPLTEQAIRLGISSPQSIANQSPHPPKLSTLLQVLQLAADRHATPHVLIVDLLHSQLPTTLSHYLQIAGFHSSVVESWQSVPIQLQHHSIDLLLICVDDTIAPATATALPKLLLTEIQQTLFQLESKPPVFVWCPVHSSATSDRQRTKQLQKIWGSIATHILPPHLSTADLLTQINQTIRRSTGVN